MTSAAKIRNAGREAATRIPTSFSLTALLLLGCVLIIGRVNSNYVTVVALSVATYAALALGLNVVMGYAGLLDMGYVAFFAIGAYTSAICTALLGLNFLLSVPIAIAVTSLAGIVIGFPTLRLRPDYLAIVTIGFGELIRTAVNNWQYAGASRGIYPLPVPEIAGFQFNSPIRQLVLGAFLLAIAVVVTNRLGRSPIGRAWRAIRDDDYVSSAIGLPTLKLKIVAYIVGGAIGALAGSIFAARSVAIDPTNFTLLLSIQIVMIVILGGLGSVRGIFFAAIVFVVLPELLRAVQDFRLLFFSVAVIIIVSWRPQGVFPERGRLVSRYRLDGELKDNDPAVVSVRPPGNSSNEYVLEVRGLSQHFSGLIALDDVTLSIPRGKVTGIIGPNGAGKTTLVNAITGVKRCSSGEVFLDNKNITGLAAHQVASLGIARTFQATRLFDSMSILENVMVAEYSHSDVNFWHALCTPRRIRRHDDACAARALALLAKVGLAAQASAYPTQLSYSDKRRAELARALNLEPELLILDEPAAGMNPKEKSELSALLRTLCADGVSVVLIEHDMPLVSSVSDEVFVLVQGRLLAQGPPATVLARPDVIDAYLGVPHDVEGGARAADR